MSSLLIAWSMRPIWNSFFFHEKNASLCFLSKAQNSCTWASWAIFCSRIEQVQTCFAFPVYDIITQPLSILWARDKPLAQAINILAYVLCYQNNGKVKEYICVRSSHLFKKRSLPFLAGRKKKLHNCSFAWNSNSHHTLKFPIDQGCIFLEVS